MTTELYHTICGWFRELVRDTRWDGHLFAVGGCCRDEVLGLPIKDLDMAVDLPDGGIAFAEWLKENGLTVGEVITFPRFGTARISLKLFPEDEIELVQTRKEKYTDRNSRCPETAFGSIEEDCMRRDLTINSLYYDICRGRLVDITGKAMHDIECHIIRTPSYPDETFDDDPVRIYRAIRFAARLGWNIDAETYAGILRNIPRLAIVTSTRCRSELERILCGPRNVEALQMLMDTGAMQYLIPELVAENQQRLFANESMTVWQHTLRVLQILDGAPLQLLMAGLLHDIGKPAVANANERGEIRFDNYEQTGSGMSRKIMRHLRFERSFIDEVDFLVRYHAWCTRGKNKANAMTDRQLRKLQYVCVTRERFNQLMILVEADNMAYPEPYGNHIFVTDILKRSHQMDEERTSMFGYKLPLSSKGIKRIMRIKTDKELKRCKDYLLKMAFINPNRTEAEFKKLLLSFK